jgi:acyl carrier protein
MDNITNKLIKILSNRFKIPENKIHLDSTLDSLGLDSFDGVEILMVLEEEFNIEISEKEFEKARTVKDYITLIKKRKGKL